MFVYDSLSDEYRREFEPEFSDDSTYVPRAIVRCNNWRSSRVSLRSFRRNFLLTRIISKTGRLNTFLIKLPNKHIQYFRDLGNTLLNIRWRWILLALLIVNFLIFFLFGLLWMWMAKASGDFETNATEACVVNTRTYVGYVLLSIESIMTIGYGYRYPTEKCVNGWIIMISQAFVSVTIQSALVSVIYVKVAKPFTKNSKSLFSKKAVISLRDGKLCFIFRIKDREAKITGALSIKTYFIDKENIKEDNFNLQQIKIEPYGFLIFPLEIVHVIDNCSPLWKISPFQLLKKRFEIIVVAEGNSLITAQLSQNRTSYINTDILWGYRFSPCIEFSSNKMKYIISYKQFNKTVSFDTPLCSAEELDQIKYELLKEIGEDKNENDGNNSTTAVAVNLYLEDSE